MGSIVARYRQVGKDGKIETIVIEKLHDGKFCNYYSYNPSAYTWGGVAGDFDTLEEAMEVLQKHRPEAELLNPMCWSCKEECAGSINMTYTNCIYKK